MIHLLRSVVQHQPRVIIGEYQAGVVLGMSTFPVILEQTCRHTALNASEMERFRRAWANVDGVLIIDPYLHLSLKGDKQLPYDMLYEAFPAMKCLQPRVTQRTIACSAGYQHEAAFARPFASMMRCAMEPRGRSAARAILASRNCAPSPLFRRRRGE